MRAPARPERRVGGQAALPLLRPPPLTARWAGAVCIVALAVIAVAVWSIGTIRDRPVLFEARFDGHDRLLTNEYAFEHPAARDAVATGDWQITSGTVLIKGSSAWTGTPDSVPPNARSTNGTNSTVFRLRTARSDFGDVDVSFRLLTAAYLATASTHAVGWDGVHLLLRYQSPRSLYAVSVNRRDGRVAIKKKVPGGRSNGGTYHTLASARYEAPVGTWQRVGVGVRNIDRRRVELQLAVDGRVLVRAVDAGTGGAPILGAGRLAIRGDNCEFRFDDFVVRSSRS